MDTRGSVDAHKTRTNENGCPMAANRSIGTGAFCVQGQPENGPMC